jgi:hypothetical protein
MRYNTIKGKRHTHLVGGEFRSGLGAVLGKQLLTRIHSVNDEDNLLGSHTLRVDQKTNRLKKYKVNQNGNNMLRALHA